MDEDYINKYSGMVYNVFLDKIMKLKGIDLGKADDPNAIDSMIKRASLDFLQLRFHMFDDDFEEFKLLDNSDIINLDADWYVGEFQAKQQFEGVSFGIDRFEENPNDITSIQLIADTDMEERIGIIENKNSTTYSITNIKDRSIQAKFDGNKLSFKNGSKSLTFDEGVLPDYSFPTILQMYRNGELSNYLDNITPALETIKPYDALKSALPNTIFSEVEDARNPQEPENNREGQDHL